MQTQRVNNPVYKKFIFLILLFFLTLSILGAVNLKDRQNPESSAATLQPKETSDIILEKKCSVSYDYKRDFQVKVCIKTPPNWQESAIGYETKITFKEDPNKVGVPLIDILRANPSDYTSFTDYVTYNKNGLYEYNGKVLDEKTEPTGVYLKAYLKVKNIPFIAEVYYYNDTKNGFYWAVTFLAPKEEYEKRFKKVAEEMVRSLEVTRVY